MPGRLFLGDPGRLGGWLGCAVPDDVPRWNIAPGQEVTCVTAEGVSRARWGLIPVGRVNARGRPVMETIVNARSETVFDKTAFAGVRRAVVPCEGWYEWTGERRRKTAWRIARADGALMGFAAIFDVWSAPGGQQVAQVATVTCAPNADLAPIHHRMGVILDRAGMDVWLGQDDDAAAALMVPLPAGILRITEAKAVDWNAP